MAHLYPKKRALLTGLGWTLAASAVVLGLFLASLSRAKSDNGAREAGLLEAAIRRASVTCYAIEGRYPESLAYLMEHYGVTIDWSRYAVQYDAFAENLSPSVAVIPLGGVG